MANGPGGQEIGRVSIRVIPDTSQFSKGKLQRQLKKEVRDAQVAVEVEVELDKKSLDKVHDELKRWTRKINPIKISVKPELALGATTLINTRLNYASRARTAPIIPYIMPNALNKVAAQMGTLTAALSGGRVVKTLATDFANWIKTLDKAAPKIALVTQGLVGIVGLGLTAGSNLFALSSSLASIGAVALTLPATFASAAIGVGVLFAALKDFNTVLPEVKSKLADLQNSISKNFWAEAKAPMQEMIAKIFPAFSTGLNSVSTQLGGFFAAFSTGLGTALLPTLPGMFAQLSSSIEIAKNAAAPLASSIATLGAAGSAYLPKMAGWVVDISTRFDEWLTKVTGNGQFDQWVQNGITALHDLGQVLKNTGGILSGIADAANAAGGSSLGMMADTLARVNEAVNTPAFQGGLIKTLTAAHDAMSNIASGAGPAMGTFFEALATTLDKLLPIAGTALGAAFGGLATALSNPAFTSGFENFIAGAADALVALGPALTPIAGMFGALGSVLGQFLSNMGPVLADVFGSLAGVFQSLLPALQPLISILTGSLGAAFQVLAPVISMIGAVMGKLALAIVPVLAKVFVALMPVLQTIAGVIGQVLGVALEAILPLLPMIGDAIAQLAPLFGQLITAVAPLITALLPALGAILGAVIPVIVSIATAVLPPVIAAITLLVAAIVPVINIIAQLVVWLLEKLAPVFTFLATVVGEFIASFIGNFTGVFESIMGIFEGFKTMFSGGWMNFFIGLGQIVVNALQLIWNVFMIVLNVTIFGVVKKGFALIKGIFSTGMEWIKLLSSVGWDFIKALPGKAFAVIKGFIVKGLNGIKGDFNLGWNALKGIVSTAWNAVKTAVSTGIGNAVTLVRGLPGKITSALGDLGSTLKNAAAQLIGGFVQGIRDKFGDVKDTLQGLTKKLTDWKGPESLDRVLLFNAGQLVIQSLVNGFESQYDVVRKSLQGLTTEIGNTVIDGPKIADLSANYSAVGSSLANNTNAAGAGGYSPQISVQMDSTHSPEDVADAILFAQKRFAYGSAYAF